jgi:hypothetical protein
MARGFWISREKKAKRRLRAKGDEKTKWGNGMILETAHCPTSAVYAARARGANVKESLPCGLELPLEDSHKTGFQDFI